MPLPGAPPLDPAAMLVFAALAREGGVRGAAAALGVPRSTVSRRLAELEAQVGAQLAVRTASRFALTELGVALAGHCAELEELVGRAANTARDASLEPSGTLRVTAGPVIGEAILPEIVAELTRRHPRLSVDVRLSVDYVDLRRGDVDVALRAWPLEDASDQRISTKQGERYVYADAVVVCGGFQSEPGTTDVLANPSVIVEVLSPGTEAYDRGEKWEAYQRLPSLTDYLLVTQTTVRVEHFQREAGGSWRYRLLEGGAGVTLTNGAVLSVDDLYAGAFAFPAA